MLLLCKSPDVVLLKHLLSPPTSNSFCLIKTKDCIRCILEQYAFHTTDNGLQIYCYAIAHADGEITRCARLTRVFFYKTALFTGRVYTMPLRMYTGRREKKFNYYCRSTNFDGLKSSYRFWRTIH